jgi:hypothetical protein
LTGGNTYQQLGIAFGLPDQPGAIELLERLVDATRAIDEIETLIKKIPSAKPSLHLRGFDRLKQGLAAAASNQDFNAWKAGYLPLEQLERIEFCAHIIEQHFPEDEVPAEELKKVNEEVSAVYESVMASGLDPDLKLTILDLLGKIKNALHAYRMKGIQPLRDTLVTATGAFILHHQQFEQAAANPEEKPLVEKLYHLLEWLDKISAIATRAQPLFKQLLPYVPYLLVAATDVVQNVKH